MNKKQFIRPQQGSTLLITLVLLLLITIATLSMFASSFIDQKATSNYVDANYAYQEAENQLFALLDAPRGRWGRLAPKRSNLAPVVIPSFPTATNAPTSTITMAYIKSKKSTLSETQAGNETGLQNIYYDVIARTKLGRAKDAHKMQALAEMPPLNSDGDPNAFINAGISY